MIGRQCAPGATRVFGVALEDLAAREKQVETAADQCRWPSSTSTTRFSPASSRDAETAAAAAARSLDARIGATRSTPHLPPQLDGVAAIHLVHRKVLELRRRRRHQ